MSQITKNKAEYSKMVDKISPNSKIFTNCIKAFVVGGLICILGQLVLNTLLNRGLSEENAGTVTSIIMIFLGVFFTGLGVYPKLGKFAGAGSIVPITGFANSVASPAIEFKKEGQIMGVGAKMFIIAGPVIVFGTITSIIIGLIHYFTGGALSV
ncbi:stage V sporulation protein AC [Anaeropeptidivorans aminofermentans]|jgi:stage V sporulation protein AC|uniref:stage V sporulation protein AC n=1 Tax=Anaeropeptidivorans aminofermentans TaxID=2934315 RepID=UPI0020253B67|nr:stage V sporulation protein AC [Anaeropeptidivorans aminofermentans]